MGCVEGRWSGGENSINDSRCFLKREVAVFKGKAISEQLVLFCLDNCGDIVKLSPSSQSMLGRGRGWFIHIHTHTPVIYKVKLLLSTTMPFFSYKKTCSLNLS